MLANTMKVNFLRLYDKNFQLGAPGYDDNGISQFLTDAQLVIYKKHYIPNQKDEGFESSEISRKDLDQFIKGASVTNATIAVSANQVEIHPNGVFYDMPTDFQWAIEEGATLTGIAAEAEVVPVTHDFYKKNIRNSYKKPCDTTIWRMDYSRVNSGYDGGDAETGKTNKRVELISDGTAITNYRLRYLITPPDIVVDELTPANQRHSLLDVSLHYEIVRLAVKMATGATEMEEYPVIAQEQKNYES